MESKKYVIAGLKVLMRCSEEHMVKQGAAYLCDFEGEPDIRIEIDPETIKKTQEKHPGLTYDELEYVLTGSRFYFQFIRFGGFLLHSSCVVEDGKAYMFSANPGTGKSTHTSLWLKYLGEDKAFILNDDKPAIRLEDGVFYAYGTPWSGKTDKNINAKYPVGAVSFIERSDKCFITDMEPRDAFKNIYWQTVKPRIEANLDMLLETCDKFIKTVPIYRFGCDISEKAVKTSYDKMTGKKYIMKSGNGLYV